MSAGPAKASPLPDAYALFAPVFERLSEPLVQVLRGLLEQLEALSSDLDPPRWAPRGVFEGLGGLTLRGDLDHIVQSELLLRTEEPMEFLRRLAESEILYHDKIYVDPGQRPIYRAMISVGPGTLGHGRLIALAVLFFMARTAAMREAAFHWCFLPRADGAVWFDEVSVNGVKRLLRAASHREISPDDVAQADEAWARLAPDAPSSAASEVVDWVIGARRRVAASGTKMAIETTPNSLGFILHPPIAGQARGVDLRVRHLGRDRPKVSLMLPSDIVCVGALKTPFRPPPARGAPVSSLDGARRSKSGWSPRYLVNAGDMTLVRLSDGLLLLRYSADRKVAQSLFAPLGADVQLAGVRLFREGFNLVVHVGGSLSERLVLGSYHLPATGLPKLTFRRIAHGSTAHLFRQQPAFALPSLSQIGAARFHSTSGQPFQLVLGNEEEMAFQPLYKGPRIISSNGVHDVMRVQDSDGARIEVVRSSGSALHSFAEDDVPLMPPKLLGMVYAHAFSSLAYSLSPNHWMFARLTAAAAAPPLAVDPLVLKSSETLLAGRPLDRAAAARIWSDARHGGEGEIRNIRVTDGRITIKQPILRLGQEATSTVAVDIGDDGVVWSLSADSRGEPSVLFRYCKHPNGGGFDRTRFDLGDHRRNAHVLDMERLHD